MSVPSEEITNHDPVATATTDAEPEAVTSAEFNPSLPDGSSGANSEEAQASVDTVLAAAPAEEVAAPEAPALATPKRGRSSKAAPPADPDTLEGALESMDFENSLAEPAEGDVVSGVIVHKDKDGALLVDIGAKSEGLVRPGEVSRTGLAEEEEEPKVGDTIKVVVIGRDKEDGKLLLSKKRADFERAWDRVEESLTDQRIIHAMVTERVKGGLVVDLGIRGFVPASHVGTGDFKHTNLDKYVGQSIPLKVIEVDREKRKVILSNKDATREERSKRRTDTLASLKEGQVREGIVRRVTDYGAFVDLGGIDGLLHVSEMSWARINHPSDVVKVGDTINVMILKMRPDQDRISLGLRQILPDPWTDVPGKYHVGDRLKVQVSRLVPFGAFVTLEGGIEAIIPNSELSQRRVSRPQDVINAGDEVDALIIELKPDERKMTLSVRRIAEQERRDQDAAAREQEYQDFRAMSSEGSARPGRDRKRRGDTPDYSQSGRVTLGDVFGEQFARARKEVSRKGRKADSQDYDEAEPDIDAEVESVVEAEAVAEPTTESAAAVEVEVQAVAEEPATESTED